MLSVVIPARNAAPALQATLAALTKQDVGEIVVADDGSTDATAVTARAAGARVVSAHGSGRAAARNAGAAATTGLLLAFLDADCRPAPGWARALAGCLGSAPLVAGPVAVTCEDGSASERFDVLWRFQQERTIRDGGWAASANLAMTREAFTALGGFDPAYRSAEDVDLCVRARHRGLRLAYCAGAQVAHPGSRTLREVLARGFRQGHESTWLYRRLEGEIGRHYWRRPGGIVRGAAALRALNVDPDALAPAERRTMVRIARAEYLARFAGSAVAQLRRM